MSSLHLLKCSSSAVCRLPKHWREFLSLRDWSECWQTGEYEQALMYDSRLINKQLKPAFSLLTSLVPLSQPTLSCQTFRLKLSKHLDEIYSPAFGQKRMLNVQSVLKPFLRFEKHVYALGPVPFIVYIIVLYSNLQLLMKYILWVCKYNVALIT